MRYIMSQYLKSFMNIKIDGMIDEYPDRQIAGHEVGPSLDIKVLSHIYPGLLQEDALNGGAMRILHPPFGSL